MRVFAPSVEGHGSSRTAVIRSKVPWIHILGGTLGGIATGLLMVLVWFVLQAVGGTTLRVSLGLALLIASLLGETRFRWRPEMLTSIWPHWRVQVSKLWLKWPSLERLAFWWGAWLGTGLLSLLITPLFYGILGMTIVVPSPLWTLAICAWYGAWRSAAVVTLMFAERAARQDRPLLLPWQWSEATRIPLLLAAGSAIAVVSLLLV